MSDESKVILFSGSKGGSGCTFIACCIFSYYAEKTDKNVVLVDLNMGKKDTRIIFNIMDGSTKDLGDIERIIDNLDASILKKLVVNFDNSLNLILPPIKSVNSKIILGKNLEILLDLLKEHFDIIGIDFPYYLYGKSYLDYIEYIDKFVIISLPDYISINNLQLLSSNICSDESCSIDILINKFNIKPAISPARINSILRYPVKAFIPYDKDIEFLFMNKGPDAVFNYNLRIVKSIEDFSKKIYEDLDYGI